MVCWVVGLLGWIVEIGECSGVDGVRNGSVLRSGG